MKGIELIRNVITENKKFSLAESVDPQRFPFMVIEKGELEKAWVELHQVVFANYPDAKYALVVGGHRRELLLSDDSWLEKSKPVLNPIYIL